MIKVVLGTGAGSSVEISGHLFLPPGEAYPAISVCHFEDTPEVCIPGSSRTLNEPDWPDPAVTSPLGGGGGTRIGVSWGCHTLCFLIIYEVYNYSISSMQRSH